jgi:hypothetical protein
MENEYVTLELDNLTEREIFIIDIFIREGRLREQERIIAKLNTLYDITCCCDSATFGAHYLSERQPDNLIDFIKRD